MVLRRGSCKVSGHSRLADIPLLRRQKAAYSRLGMALADSLELRNVRTLKDYDTDPRNITLSRIDRFLFVNNLTLQQLISFGTDM